MEDSHVELEINAVTETGEVRRRQFRWKLADDIALAKEVQDKLPFLKPFRQQGTYWTEIANALNTAFRTTTHNQTSVNRRFNRVLKNHRASDTQNRYNYSGKAEDFLELQESLTDLMNRLDNKRVQEDHTYDNKQKKGDDEKANAEEICGAAVNTVKRGASEEEGKISKKRVTEKNRESDRRDREQQQKLQIEERSKDRELEEKGLSLQQQQMKLEKSRFEYQKQKEESEIKLREKQLEIQEKDRQAQIAIQYALIEMLVKKISNE